MKSIDFSKPGGFPLTQERLSHLQSAYTEAIGALGGLVSDGTVPVIISGMNITSSGFTTLTYHPGWFYYNNELIRFPGLTTPASIALGSSLYVVISETAGGVYYNDGVSNNVIKEKTATIAWLPGGTPADPTRFLFSALVPYAQAFAAKNKEASFAHITFSTPGGSGTVSGDLYYKRNFLTNTLHMYGVFVSLTPGDFSTLPSVSSTLVATLPAAYCPTTFRAPFLAQVSAGGNLVTDDSGTFYPTLKCSLETDGSIYIDFVKSSTGIPFVFNTILPLD